ncbi:hypothetical protein [Filimonas lacunae]|nr:hypothetical protein [Filimonas lacunae]
MTVLFKSVFRFDLDRNTPVEITISTEANDFSFYIEQLIVDVIGDQRSKKYLFPDEPTALITMINSLGDEIKRPTLLLDAAKRLLRKEENVQQRIEHLNREVQKGIMIQALVEYNEELLFLIIKAEHSDFINETDNKKATGLPIKKKIFKAFCAYCDNNFIPLYAKVSDYRTVISSYWWKDFLELVEEYTNEHNTEKSFDMMDRKVFSGLKAKHPRDWMIIRNATVQYYRSMPEFVMEDYLNDIIVSYVPEDSELNMNAVATNIRSLPDRCKFEGRFQIVRSCLKKRMIYKLNLTPQLELIIKEDINLDSSVLAFTEHGEKYIKIKTDVGFNYFKTQQINDSSE